MDTGALHAEKIIKDYRERLCRLRALIEKNQAADDELSVRWEDLDASEQQELGELDAYLDGLRDALAVVEPPDVAVDARQLPLKGIE